MNNNKRKMKRIINKFQLIIYCRSEEGIFMNVNESFQGAVIIDLAKTMKIRSIMIGRSTSLHSSELTFDNTRIGKQIYVESVKTLFGDEDCQRSYLHSAGEQVYNFEVRDHLPVETSNGDSATKLSWTNLKAVLVDHHGKTIFSDVFVQNLSAKPEHTQNANVLTDYKYLETNEHQPNRIHRPLKNETRDFRAGGDSRNAKNLVDYDGDDGLLENAKERLTLNVNYENEVHKYTKTRSGIDIQCKLRKSFYKMDEAVAFVIQCENNTKRGYRHISASLIERTPNNTQHCRKPSVTRTKQHRAKQSIKASIIGPPIGPKELVIWDGVLTPIVSNASGECWYTLRIEVDTKFLTKEQIEIPVIIMDDPRTPITTESTTKL